MGGVTTCEKHGELAPVVHVCEHVRAQIEAGEAPVGHRLDACILLMVCTRCFTTGGFDEVAKLPGPPFPDKEYRHLSREMRDEYDNWMLEMLEAVEAPYATLQHQMGYCLQCFEEFGPKDLSEPSS